ncbi:hypothetical protein AYI70_g9105 [Smittium culicis]|uniref:Uncharacterized protein n=1 Tax=Smittium culicis TaxID=133412 RepID=A0A1R1XCY4_9FUNG|nr:hypothetical protein AYI70_g9105 [Smittium culicis]
MSQNNSANYYGVNDTITNGPMRVDQSIEGLSEFEIHLKNPNRPGFLTPVSNLHMDVLNGQDETINVEDILYDVSDKRLNDVHATIVKDLRL